MYSQACVALSGKVPALRAVVFSLLPDSAIKLYQAAKVPRGRSTLHLDFKISTFDMTHLFPRMESDNLLPDINTLAYIREMDPLLHAPGLPLCYCRHHTVSSQTSAGLGVPVPTDSPPGVLAGTCVTFVDLPYN